MESMTHEAMCSPCPPADGPRGGRPEEAGGRSARDLLDGADVAAGEGIGCVEPLDIQ